MRLEAISMNRRAGVPPALGVLACKAGQSPARRTSVQGPNPRNGFRRIFSPSTPAEGRTLRVPRIRRQSCTNGNLLSSSPRDCFTRQRAFTLIEIALCIAIIGFALVAIVGTLPTGMNMQKLNRAETFIAEDGLYWMEALRSGARGLDDLTNFVDEIVVGGNTNTLGNGYWTGADIIGLLSTPGVGAQATVRSLSGSAAEKAQAIRDFAFKYVMEVDIQPSRRAAEVLNDGLHEVSLRFRWPVLRNEPPPRSQVFRAQFNGSPEEDPPNSQRFFFNP